jgi:hypothetical protein
MAITARGTTPTSIPNLAAVRDEPNFLYSMNAACLILVREISAETNRAKHVLVGIPDQYPSRNRSNAATGDVR